MRIFIAALLLGMLFAFPQQVAFAEGGALEPPMLFYPTADDSPVWKGQMRFQWKTPAPFSQYHIDLPSGESLEEVVGSQEKTIAGLAIGEYFWSVRACQDRKGDRCGSWEESQRERFEIVPAPPEATGGLIPCGRQHDDTIATPDIDESKPCGLPHFVLLLKNLLDFVLWRLALLVVAVLAVATGFFTYFSFGAPDIGVRIRALWRSLFVGYLLLLFAWFFVNLLLNLLGFRTALFGQWWQLPF